MTVAADQSTIHTNAARIDPNYRARPLLENDECKHQRIAAPPAIIMHMRGYSIPASTGIHCRARSTPRLRYENKEKDLQ